MLDNDTTLSDEREGDDLVPSQEIPNDDKIPSDQQDRDDLIPPRIRISEDKNIPADA